jgi:hypothetical protein
MLLAMLLDVFRVRVSAGLPIVIHSLDTSVIRIFVLLFGGEID